MKHNKLILTWALIQLHKRGGLFVDKLKLFESMNLMMTKTR